MSMCRQRHSAATSSILLGLAFLARANAATEIRGPLRSDHWSLARTSNVIAIGEVLTVRPLPLAARLLRASADQLESMEHKAKGTFAGDLIMVANDRLAESGLVVPSHGNWFEGTLEVERALALDEQSRRRDPSTLRIRFREGPEGTGGFVPGRRILVFAHRRGHQLEAFVGSAVPVHDESQLEDMISAVLAARAGQLWSFPVCELIVH
jgi:hypothetical protein